MLLPQSSAFISLRNRLNSVSSLGFVHVTPKPPAPSTTTTIRSKLGGRDDAIRWSELLSHFRTIQMKHEKARRGESVFTSSPDSDSVNAFPPASPASAGLPQLRPALRRKVTGVELPTTNTKGVNHPIPLSPLNPKRASSANSSATIGSGSTNGRPMSPGPNKQRRTLGVAATRR